ncbi:MAG TPA: CRISPR-associated endonuclease Cas1 [Bacteroidales bacterium]|nr:CRISPR-associated endonuclease Cas1 [Bacteroidales bacterium]HPR72990.1 CRISPR-associated endonuclease Cas1 [Bacteroidales bacterium]
MQLVIDKYGTEICVKDDMFHIKAEDESRMFAADKVDSILVTKTAAITTSAIKLAVENGIEVIFMDRGGVPYARLWSNKFGSITTIRRRQLEFSRSAAAVGWIKKLVLRKLDNQLALLFSLQKADGSTNELINKTTDRIEGYRKKIRTVKGSSIPEISSSIRGWEGSASRWYFSCISSNLPSQYSFEGRSQHPASDMFNSMLNYAYGILYHRVEGALIKAGIDPYIGIMHRDEYNRPVFTYDFIENFRIWADFVVLNLCMQEVIFREFFVIDHGTCYLDTPGKRILVNAFNDYFAEVVLYNNLERSRNTHIDLAAQDFASFLLKWKFEGES